MAEPFKLLTRVPLTDIDPETGETIEYGYKTVIFPEEDITYTDGNGTKRNLPGAWPKKIVNTIASPFLPADNERMRAGTAPGLVLSNPASTVSLLAKSSDYIGQIKKSTTIKGAKEAFQALKRIGDPNKIKEGAKALEEVTRSLTSARATKAARTAGEITEQAIQDQRLYNEAVGSGEIPEGLSYFKDRLVWWKKLGGKL